MRFLYILSMTKLTEKELENMKHNELLEHCKKLQELFFAPKKNSQNSSKPPSTDNENTNPKKNQSLRKKSGKSSWGQTWHEGRTREHQKPNEIVTHNKTHCDACNADLTQNTRRTAEVRQEIDIPPIVAYITQHERQETQCSCGCKVSWKFPSHIKWHTQFWAEIAALTTYFNIRHKIPYQRLTEVFNEVMELKISEWSIENILQKVGVNAEEKCEEIMKWIQSSSYVWADETGNHVNGKKWWVRTRQSESFAYICLEMSRWYQVVEKHFWETFEWILWHDCWAAHNNTTASEHQLCLAHLHRDLNYVVEKDGTLRSYLLRKALLKAQKAKKRWLSGEIFDSKREKIKLYYHNLLERLCQRADSWYKDTMRLIKRVKKHKDKIWTFLKYKYVPSHNNASEQVIRNQKIHKKISWGFRSLEWWKRHCNILSVIETSRRHGLEVLGSIRLLYQWDLTRVRPE